MEEKTTKKNYVVQETCYLWILTLAGGSDKGRLGRVVPGFQILPTFSSTTKGCGSSCWGKEDWVSDLRRRDCIPLPSGTRWYWTYGYPNRWEWPADGKWHLALAEAGSDEFWVFLLPQFAFWFMSLFIWLFLLIQGSSNIFINTQALFHQYPLLGDTIQRSDPLRFLGLPQRKSWEEWAVLQNEMIK